MEIKYILAFTLINVSSVSEAAFILYDRNNQKDIDQYDNEICRSKIDGNYSYGKIDDNRCIINIDANAVETTSFEVLEDNAPRFKSYKPNYVGFIPNTHDTDAHVEMFYSFKYRISDIRINENHPFDNYLFLAYTGKFDFFWGSKDSSPVINRLNNPELHYRRYLSAPGKEGNFIHKYIDFSYGHESNGQVISDITSFLDAGNDAIDHVSRGWDYLSFDYKFEINNKNGCDFIDTSCFYGYAYLRTFLHDGILQGAVEDEIFWDPAINTRIEDFDGVRLIFGKEHPFGKGKFPTKGVWVNYRTGISSPGKNNSFSLNYRKEIHLWDFKLPLYARYFNGYGNEIVTYHKRDRIVMFGLQFR